MNMNLIAQQLRFPADDVRCKGDQHQRGCSAGPEFDSADAIHTWNGMNFCATHSPFDNKYVPCAACGITPVVGGGNAYCEGCQEHNECEDCGDDLVVDSTGDLTCPSRCEMV